jgi:lysyl-tRNA synthetase class 2
VLSTVLVLAVFYAAFRSRRAVDPLTEDDEKRLRALLERQGERDSLGYFALRREKSVVWSPTGKAAVAYRVVGGVSLASGDPIGDPEAWPGAIEPWLAEARVHGWIPAVMGASEEAGTVYARHGLDALELGDEALVEVGRVHPRRARHADRPAGLQPGEARRVHRAHPAPRGHPGRRDGVPAEAGRRLAGRGHRARVQHGARAARGSGRRAVRDARMHRRGGRVEGGAVLRAVGAARAVPRPDAAGPGLRQRADGVHGDRTPPPAQEIGITQVSLNFAMFRSVFERGARIGAGPVLRLWRSLLSFFSRWWQIESLYRANAKYRPIWEPRFLLFEKSADLLRIGLAAARAEGFLEAPGLPKWLHRKHLETHR